MNDLAPDLSIIIPAFNEEKRLPRALGLLRNYFASAKVSAGEIEILVVDDGSTDGTARITEEWARQMPVIRLVSNGTNRGKGYSVKHGMLEARGRIALFTDADLSLRRSRNRKSCSRRFAMETMWRLVRGRSIAL